MLRHVHDTDELARILASDATERGEARHQLYDAFPECVDTIRALSVDELAEGVLRYLGPWDTSVGA